MAITDTIELIMVTDTIILNITAITIMTSRRPILGELQVPMGVQVYKLHRLIEKFCLQF